jgi:hypothetical protein
LVSGLGLKKESQTENFHIKAHIYTARPWYPTNTINPIFAGDSRTDILFFSGDLIEVQFVAACLSVDEVQGCDGGIVAQTLRRGDGDPSSMTLLHGR